ncbi:endonuclease/exonuclease/phosphatase family protein [Azospirillum soli]|uniref:endonuclease/exonuclease/phosphatase family protein n=1 Tax=Azospirillum soli TaxID=1304799 RepID=UPI001AE86DDB|nr:endonuclease/exonuclease/phosphatase family protein [Azospirillum soli]MBP2311483.1 endonuclease/exonuclease/phosphatase family metal-dependent hydrolase [Azospirillum soli]
MRLPLRATLVALALLSACAQQPEPPSASPTAPQPEAAARIARTAPALTLATWNLEWLTTRQQGLPSNVRPRPAAAFDALQRYAAQLNGDIVAFQEVDGAENAARVFNPSHYKIEIADERDVQRVGFAIRNGLSYTRNPDVVGLDPTGSLRRGVDVTVNLNGQPLRLLAVHLKSGCFDAPITSAADACRSLSRQLPVLRTWIAERTREGIPFAILGDFNRRFEPTPQGQPDPAWVAIGAPQAQLVRVTEGRRSECWGGEYPKYIDHIVLSPKAASLVGAQTFRQLVYSESGPRAKELLSDHCPISVQLQPQPTS